MNPVPTDALEPPAATILIAEDHADSREALRALLEAAGYEVVPARDGFEAVDAALRAKPDLLILDVMMPRMDGLEATRALRSTPDFRQVPIIALTAVEGAREQAMLAGCDDFIAKPIDVAGLFRKVQGWVERGRARPV